MRVGIFGGSFNPIHTGHIRIGEWICKKGYVDELWFMVSPLNPLKQGATDLLPDEARLRLARIAVQGKRGLRVSDFEMHLPRPSYMVTTLAELRRAYPDLDFSLVIGADNWLRFSQWKDSDEIMRLHEIIVYPRPHCAIDTSALPSSVHLISSPMFDISSTSIRHAIAAGGYRGRGLAPAVWKEIKQQGYYQ